MVADALKGYIQLANGLTDVTKDRASAAAKSLAAQSPELLGTAATTAASTAAAAATQVQTFAEELLVTSRDNRALLMGLIRTEVERLVTALGFAKESEVDAVRHKVDKLEETVDGLADGAPSTPSLRVALTPTKKASAAKKAPGTKPATKKAPARKAATATKPATKKAPASKAAPAKATAKKTPTKKAAAKPAPPPPASAVTTAATPLIPPTAAVAPAAAAAATTAPDVVDLTRTEAVSPAPPAPRAAPPSGVDGSSA